MSQTLIFELVHNAALLAAMVIIFDVLMARWQQRRFSTSQVIAGLCLSAVGILIMLSPVVYLPGIVFDTRSILVGLTGLFFGAVPCLILMGILAIFRLSQGGAALTGILVILATGIIGIGWGHLRSYLARRRPWSLEAVRFGELYVFGLVLHAVMLLLMFTLPSETALSVLSVITLPVLVIYPLGTAMLGLLLANRLRRERLSQDLRDSEERLRLAVQAANIGFFVRDLTCDREIYSTEWKKQLGYEEHEIGDSGTEWTSRVHPEDLERVVARENDYIEGRKPDYEASFRMRHKDGSYHWMLSRGILQYDARGRAVKLLGCHIDITRQKQFENNILSSERRFRGLAESSQDYIMLYDRECRHVYMNPAALRVGGHTEADIIGKTHGEAGFSEELSILWETDIQRVFQEGSSAQRLFEWESADGPVFLDWRLSPVFDEKGNVELVLGISRDITELKKAEQALKKSEEQYRVLTETMKDVVWVMDAETLRFRYVSPSVERLRGYKPEEVMAETIDAALLPAASEFIRKMIRRRVEDLHQGRITPDQYFTEEVEQPCKDGSTVWTEAITCFYLNPANGRTEVMGVTRDITTRKQAEEREKAAQAELRRLLSEADQARRVLLSVAEDQRRAEEEVRQLNAELEKRVFERTVQLETANQELEAFAYSVSHDLRAPLRAMDGFSTALLQSYSDQLDEQGRHFLNRIQEASRRMGQLINDLLSLSRVTRTELVRQRIDLSKIALEVSQELLAQNPERQIQFDICPGMVIQADAHLLKIAMENLLNNAVKFTGLRPVAQIQVGMTQIDGECAYFVKDNGVGFDMAYAGHLFAPFQRLHGMQEFPGTGIGLVTVQRIIRRHGGRIWPVAQLNQGAAFYFTLGGF